MATRFYFHNATSTQINLPTDKQSTLTANNSPSTNPEARTINRTMTITKGTSEVSKVCTSNATTSSQNYYFTRWVSDPLNVSSVTAQTWTYAVSTKESNANANFPIDEAGGPSAGRAVVYVWRPSTQTKFGVIRDGTTAANILEASATQQFSDVTTFSGAAVTSMVSGDVIICELWAITSQASANAYSLTYYYDGATVPTDDQQESGVATYLETPQTLTFAPLEIDMTQAAAKTYANKFITKV